MHSDKPPPLRIFFHRTAVRRQAIPSQAPGPKADRTRPAATARLRRHAGGPLARLRVVPRQAVGPPRPALLRGPATAAAGPRQIGRASCRERVEKAVLEAA